MSKESYKRLLEELARAKKITTIWEQHKDNMVHFELIVPNLKNYSDADIEKDFKLMNNSILDSN